VHEILNLAFLFQFLKKKIFIDIIGSCSAFGKKLHSFFAKVGRGRETEFLQRWGLGSETLKVN
jgi:hypothetical protein